MKKSIAMAVVILATFGGVSAETQNVIDAPQTTSTKCQVNDSIQRKALPQTPHNMSLPAFGQGVIGWATGEQGAKTRLENIEKGDLKAIQEKGTTLAMVKEWQAFYENEVKRNPCNPTAPYRAELMKKIAWLWVE